MRSAPRSLCFDAQAGELTQVADTSGDEMLDDDPELLGQVGTGLLFSALDANDAAKVFLFDPNATTPLVQLSDTAGTGKDDDVLEWAASDTCVYLAASDANGDSKLFACDLTTGEQRQVVDINGPGSGDSPCDFEVLSDGRFALAFDSAAAGGFSIYVHDPEQHATYLVADPAVGRPWQCRRRRRADGELFLSAHDTGGGVMPYVVE